MDVLKEAAKITERHWKKHGEKLIKRAMFKLIDRLNKLVLNKQLLMEDARTLFNLSINALARRLEISRVRVAELGKNRARRRK